jgi:hypothetical protein
MFSSRINSDSAVTQLWSPVTLRNLEDGSDMFSETSVLIRITWCKVLQDMYIVTAVKTSQNKAQKTYLNIWSLNAVSKESIASMFRVRKR